MRSVESIFDIFQPKLKTVQTEQVGSFTATFLFFSPVILFAVIWVLTLFSLSVFFLSIEVSSELISCFASITYWMGVHLVEVPSN